jgi:hypothetical protein
LTITEAEAGRGRSASGSRSGTARWTRATSTPSIDAVLAVLGHKSVLERLAALG